MNPLEAAPPIAHRAVPSSGGHWRPAEAAACAGKGAAVTAVLEVRGVGVSFGGLAALRDVTFVLPRAAIHGVIGPNGAGKTTLFNVLGGVIPPDAGRVSFLGEDITGLPPYRIARLGLARTYQIVRPLGELTVLENAMVGAFFGRHQLAGARPKRALPRRCIGSVLAIGWSRRRSH